MKKRTHSIDITPDKSLIKKLGMAGYKTEQAIAELIDNSIDARIPDMAEKIQVTLDFATGTVTIRDDGCGMDKDKLTAGMTIASNARGGDSRNTLGRFGIGMKGACSFLGKVFSVRTSPRGSCVEYGMKYDEKEWLGDASQKWKNFEISERVLLETESWHGTEIKITDVNVPLYPNQISKFKEKFAVRYSPYIESGQISIQINSVQCTPSLQDIEEDSQSEIEIATSNNHKITGTIALLKKRSIRGDYGIHLFQNKRLIQAFAKFGFAAHPENARIVGKLNLNHVPVNYTKTGFMSESLEYRDAEHAFETSDEFKSILHKSRSAPRQIPTIQSLFDYFAGKKNPGVKHKLDARLRTKSMQDAIGAAKSFVIDVDGEKSIKIDFVSCGEDSRLYTISDSKGMQEIHINKDSKAFKFVKNHLFLIGLVISESILLAHHITDAKDVLERRNDIMNAFLNDWSEQKSHSPANRAATNGHRVQDFHDNAQYVPGYELDRNLAAVYAHLDKNSEFKFQFTAMSTLAPYMHTMREKLAYTIYTVPHHGEYIADILEDVIDSRMVALHNPQADTINTILQTKGIDSVIAIREDSRLTGKAIATPDKAFADLVTEARVYGVPIDDLELGRIFSAMARIGIVNSDRVMARIRRKKALKNIQAIMRTQVT